MIDCTPSGLLAQAKCFLCLTPKQKKAVRSLLLQQFVPCVPVGSPIGTVPSVGCRAPLAPASLEVSNSPNNPGSTTITVDWTQPLNIPPMAATGYVVKWGTSSGNYNVGSAAIGPAPLAYTITGLANSTTYFIVVYALNGLCVSGASNEIQGTTMNASGTCNAGTVFAQAWAARVVANGGAAPSAATQLAVANFQCGLITDGLDTSMLSWNAFVSDNLIAAITPQLLSVAVGSFDPWTNHNFVLADLNVSGLIGNGANKFLATGMNQQDPAFWGPNVANNCGITAYVENNPNGAQAVITGNSDGGASLFALEMFGGNTEIILWDVASDIVAANAGFTGYVSCNRTAINSLAIYEANSGIPHHTLATSAVNNGGSVTTNAFPIVVFCFSDNTGTSLFEYKRLGFIAFHKGLSSAQSALFSARVQTLMSALGRAI